MMQQFGRLSCQSIGPVHVEVVCITAVIVVGSIGWLVFIAMLGVLIYYRRYVLSSARSTF